MTYPRPPHGILISALSALIVVSAWTACGPESDVAPQETAGNWVLQDLFHQPLITGASISSDTGTMSPGKRAGLRHTSAEKISTIARGGMPGLKLIEEIDADIISDRSVVLAIDFFFWDSTLPSMEASLAVLDRLMTLALEAGAPLVLGDIPALLPARRQPGREALNIALRAQCRPERACFLLPLEQIYGQAFRKGIVIDGRRYELRELLPDGLHLSEPASEYLADLIIELFKR